MTQKTNELQVLSIDFRNMPEYKGAKENQESLVKEHPFIKIVDSETYEAAKKSRTALRQGRYDLQNGEKAIASQIKSFRGYVKSETDNLVAITLPHEEKQQEEVARYEAIKKAEKEEKERIERERIEGLKTQIIEFRDSYKKAINEYQLKSDHDLKVMIENTHLEVEDFEADFILVKEQLLQQLDEKIEALKEAEKLAEEKTRLAEEKRKLDEKTRLADEKIAKEKKDQEEENRLAQEKLAKERADFEKEKRELELADRERIAKEKRIENEKREAIEKREELINRVLELAPDGNRKDAEAMTTEGLKEFISKIEKANEKLRLEALKSDKEKLMTIVKTLRIDYDPVIILNDKSADNLLAEFIGEADRLMNKYIELVNNL